MGLRDRKKRLAPRFSIPAAHRNEIVLPGLTRADEAVDQIESVAGERRVAGLPGMRKQQCRCSPIRAAFRARAGQGERREKILQEIAPALVAMKDVEWRNGGARMQEAAPVKVDEIFAAD